MMETLPQAPENGRINERPGRRANVNSGSNCNPCFNQEEQPLNLHMSRNPSAQVVGER